MFLKSLVIFNVVSSRPEGQTSEGDLEMCRMVGLIIIFALVLSGCHGSLLLVDTHPELNRHFRLGIDHPGEWPY